MAETAPKHICGNCGDEIYCVGKPVFCPLCKMKWELAEWFKPPAVGSEKWLKYHKQETN